MIRLGECFPEITARPSAAEKLNPLFGPEGLNIIKRRISS
jgi:hypothetical protein